jgi:N utilization substance protein B
MKRLDDPRHIKRMHLVKQLFARSFTQNQPFSPEVIEMSKDFERIDGIIQGCAPEWPIAQINRIDLSILRQSIYELSHKNTPTKVVIDEAVELAKEFGSESSPKFVNGVLGSVVTKLKKATDTNKQA